MGPVDYTKQLSKERDIYWKNLQEQKDSHENHVKTLNASHEHKLKSASENYKTDKLKMEKEFGDRYEKISEKQSEALYNKNREYQKLVSEKQKDFQAKRLADRENFNIKFSEIRDGYERNLKETDQSNKSIQGDLKKSYEAKVNSIRNDFADDISQYDENSQGDKKLIQARNAAERRQLQRRHNEEKTQIIKDELDKRNLIKEEAVADIAKIRKTQNDELLLSRDRQKAKFNKLTTDAEKKVQTAQSRMEEEIRRLGSAQSKEIRAQNKAFSSRFEDQEKRYNKDLRDMERDSRRNSFAPGSAQFEIAQNQRKSFEIDANERVERVRKAANLDRANMEKSLLEAQETFNQNYKKQKMQAAEQLQKQKWEITSSQVANRTAERLNGDKLQKAYKDAQDYQNRVANQKVADKTKETNRQLENMKSAFAESINSNNEKTREQLEALRAEANKEKREIQQRLGERNIEQKNIVRENFERRIQKMQKGFDQKIQNLESQNEYLQNKISSVYEDAQSKAQTIIERNQKELGKQMEIELANERDLHKRKIEAVRKNLTQANQENVKKMNEARVATAKKIRDMERVFKNTLDNERRKYQDLTEVNKRYFEREFERLKLVSQAEKDRIVSQYENRIEQLKKVLENTKEETQNFQSLNRA